MAPVREIHWIKAVVKGLEALCLDSISGRCENKWGTVPQGYGYSQYLVCCLLQWHKRALVFLLKPESSKWKTVELNLQFNSIVLVPKSIGNSAFGFVLTTRWSGRGCCHQYLCSWRMILTTQLWKGMVDSKETEFNSECLLRFLKIFSLYCTTSPWVYYNNALIY